MPGTETLQGQASDTWFLETLLGLIMHNVGFLNTEKLLSGQVVAILALLVFFEIFGTFFVSCFSFFVST